MAGVVVWAVTGTTLHLCDAQEPGNPVIERFYLETLPAVSIMRLAAIGAKSLLTDCSLHKNGALDKARAMGEVWDRLFLGEDPIDRDAQKRAVEEYVAKVAAAIKEEKSND